MLITILVNTTHVAFSLTGASQWPFCGTITCSCDHSWDWRRRIDVRISDAVHKSIGYLYSWFELRPYLNCPIRCWTIIVHSRSLIPTIRAHFLDFYSSSNLSHNQIHNSQLFQIINYPYVNIHLHEKHWRFFKNNFFSKNFFFGGKGGRNFFKHKYFYNQQKKFFSQKTKNFSRQLLKIYATFFHQFKKTLCKKNFLEILTIFYPLPKILKTWQKNDFFLLQKIYFAQKKFWKHWR